MDEELDSQFKKLAAPHFKSTIPSHLLGRLTEQERYLVETLSVVEQQNRWLIDTLVDTNVAVRKSDVRIAKIETWKNNLTSKGAVIGVVGVVILTALVKELLDHWMP
jgi:hypothetical protein